MRFVRQFEFADLQSFKLALAREKTLPAEVMPLDPLVQDDDDLSTMMHKLSQTGIAAVRDLPDELDQSAVQSAITTLRQARHIYLVGVSASALVAQDLYLKLIRAGYVAIFDHDTHTAVERAYYTTPADAMVVFSYSGLTKEVVLAAQQARRNQTPVIAVTRHEPSPLREAASCVIALPPTEPLLRIGAVTSMFTETYVANILFLGVVQGEIKKTEQNYRATSQLTSELKIRGEKYVNRRLNDRAKKSGQHTHRHNDNA
ncbi:transcriptional regulator [Lacticaseibacillus paracasei subsp. paracasei Lpp41]|uniref:Transcriptional regulator n=1 Tax=Lacticaseibacillus paracasei subsp. paracasei Lpp41 TaxID=1256208 RepID=A0A829H5K6_LACPA|nr:transcriptional regulator [Lacticaseibacillus paracasei subsp. paracasei Lpp41]